MAIERRKKVLINSTLLTLPTYVMFILLLPLEICENLASAISQNSSGASIFLRGEFTRKMEKAMFTKRRGWDWFLNDLRVQHGFIGKQFWRLVQYPDSLVARVLRGGYYRMSSLLRINSVHNPSYVWTSISASQKLLLLGIRQKIHFGYEVKV